MTILVDARFDDYPDLDGASSGHAGNGFNPVPTMTGANGNWVNGYAAPSGTPGILDLVPDPAATGKTVCKVTLDPSQPLMGGHYHRSEMVFALENNRGINAPSVQMPNNNSSDYWHWYAFYLPDDWNPGMPVVIMQLHDVPDGFMSDAPITGNSAASGIEPNLILTNCFYDSYWANSSLGQLMFRSCVPSADNQIPTLLNTENRYLPQFGGLPLRRWVEVVVRYNAQLDATGIIEIWIDRRKVFSEHHRNTYSNVYGLSLHIGLYGYWSGAGGIWNMRGAKTVMYTKGAVIGDKNCADFGAFMAGMGWPHKTELERTLVNGISMA